jgi:polyhydroxyalkanoate synthesis regulator phasin
VLYDISKEDFADHVRHATTWNDLGVRCGLEKNKHGQIPNFRLWMLQDKVHNMKLNIDHFLLRKPVIPDDVFKTIVRESTCLKHVMRKCKMEKAHNKEKIIKRIKDLCIDITHFKTRKPRTEYKIWSNKVDAIDDETFKTLLKNSRNLTAFVMACGFKPGKNRKFFTDRIEMLGLDTKHFDCWRFDDDKIFVVESKYTGKEKIKKRLVRDFDRPYECSKCKNEHFTKRDGVLMWNDQEIVLQLEHINGVNNDNRLENLTFLCPNCHSQTSTYSGRNSKKTKLKKEWVEDGKIEHESGSIASLLN